MIKLMSTVLIAASMVFPAYAGGSMAQDVKVIVVHPKGELYRLGEQRKMEKARDSAEKAETKARLQAGKQLVKEMETRQRDYEKKIEKARKAKK